jgi:lysophospholipase L1-like esterase
MRMRWFALGTLVLVCACGEAKVDKRDRALELGRAVLTATRLENRAALEGKALEGDALLADSLLTRLERMGDGCVRTWVDSGAGECLTRIDSLIALTGGMEPEQAAADPAAAVIEVLRDAPEVTDAARPLLEGYAAVLMQNMDESREIATRLRPIEFLQAAGIPVTYRDLGLAGGDTLRLMALAEAMAARGPKAPFGVAAFDFFIAMRRLDDVGSRFSGQKNAGDLAASVMAGPGFDSLRPVLAALPPVTIAFFGDSQTDNRHWSSPAHFPNVIQAVFDSVNPGIKVVNAGIGGDDSGEGLARIQTDVLDKAPNVCFVLFGGNDCMFWGRDHSSVSPEQFRQNTADIAFRLKAIGCRVVLMSYPRIPSMQEPEAVTLEQMNIALGAIRDSLGAEWLDVAGMFAQHEPRRMFAPDMIHYCPEAHLLLARQVLEYLALGK